LGLADYRNHGQMSPLPTRNQAIFVCAFVALTVLACTGLLSAAAIAPAPPVVLPLIIAICIGIPMCGAWELRPAVTTLRTRRNARLIADMGRFLDTLPETQHPLDR
jgi:hypothetical protein